MPALDFFVIFAHATYTLLVFHLYLIIKLQIIIKIKINITDEVEHHTMSPLEFYNSTPPQNVAHGMVHLSLFAHISLKHICK